ncbi:MAG TPA: flagellar basal body protein [Gammaproteobacteria bacterium]|nr:flagellar basal body protein [Gammaproteobacteria bacterium]
MPHVQFLRYYGEALVLDAERARLVASNIANSDTPGYKARDIDFRNALQARLQDPARPPRVEYRQGLPVGLDGNDVSLPYESVAAARNARRTAATLKFLDQSTQGLIQALRPQSNGG